VSKQLLLVRGLKGIKTFNSIQMSRLTRRLAKKLAPCTPLNPEILRQIFPKLGAVFVDGKCELVTEQAGCWVNWQPSMALSASPSIRSDGGAAHFAPSQPKTIMVVKGKDSEVKTLNPSAMSNRHEATASIMA
jgi:hypothetical protein